MIFSSVKVNVETVCRMFYSHKRHFSPHWCIENNKLAVNIRIYRDTDKHTWTNTHAHTQRVRSQIRAVETVALRSWSILLLWHHSTFLHSHSFPLPQAHTHLILTISPGLSCNWFPCQQNSVTSSEPTDTSIYDLSSITQFHLLTHTWSNQQWRSLNLAQNARTIPHVFKKCWKGQEKERKWSDRTGSVICGEQRGEKTTGN